MVTSRGVTLDTTFAQAGSSKAVAYAIRAILPFLVGAVREIGDLSTYEVSMDKAFDELFSDSVCLNFLTSTRNMSDNLNP